MKSGIVQMSTYFGQDQDGPPRRMIDVFTDDAKAVVESPNWITKYDLPAGWRFGYDIINVFGAGFSAAYTTADAGGGAITMTNTFGANTGGGAADGVITNVTADATGLVFTGINGGFNGTVDLSAAIAAFETTTTLVDNLNGTYTYTNEDGVATTISAAAETVTTLTDVGGGTYRYTSEDGTVTNIATADVVTTFVDNLDGTYTYTSEDGTQTTTTAATAENYYNTDLVGTGPRFHSSVHGVIEDHTYVGYENRFRKFGNQFQTYIRLPDLSVTSYLDVSSSNAELHHKSPSGFNRLKLNNDGTAEFGNWGTDIGFKLAPNQMQARTPDVRDGAAVNGYVLTLMDSATGEMEWQPGAGGQNYANASLTADADYIHNWGPYRQTENFNDGVRSASANWHHDQMMLSVADSSTVSHSRLLLDQQQFEMKSSQTSGGVNRTGLVATNNAGEAWIRSSYSLGGHVGFEVANDIVKVRTFGVESATATVGQVLTITDATTGAAEWQTAAGGVNAVNDLASIPSPLTVTAGTVYLVNNDATAANNGLWKADGPVGSTAVGWTQI